MVHHPLDMVVDVRRVDVLLGRENPCRSLDRFRPAIELNDLIHPKRSSGDPFQQVGHRRWIAGFMGQSQGQIGGGGAHLDFTM